MHGPINIRFFGIVCIKLISLYSTIKMMHGPINIRFFGIVCIKLVSLYSTIKMMHGPINVRFFGIVRSFHSRSPVCFSTKKLHWELLKGMCQKSTNEDRGKNRRTGMSGQFYTSAFRISLIYRLRLPYLAVWNTNGKRQTLVHSTSTENYGFIPPNAFNSRKCFLSV